MTNDNSITNNKLQITNNGKEVASIDASGSAYFRELVLDKYLDATGSAVVIAAADNFTKNGIYAPAIETQAQTAGIGLLPTGQQELIIYNERVKDNSLIYLTPSEQIPSPTGQLTVVKKESCLAPRSLGEVGSTVCKTYFKVAINNPTNKDLKFNWLIIN